MKDQSIKVRMCLLAEAAPLETTNLRQADGGESHDTINTDLSIEAALRPLEPRK